MKQSHAELMSKIANTKDLDKDAEALLTGAVSEFKKNWA
jgi:F-type H+-transporting ATPase subunit alpha